MNLSVVIPVYNGAQTVGPLVERLAAVLPSLAEFYETILVVDGSPDNSWEVVQQLAKKHPWVRGFNLIRNFGQHNALLCGVHAARYEIIVTMDDDLQHPPEEIHHLLEKLEEGYDVVYGMPRRRPHAWWRILGSVLTKWAIGFVAGNKVLRNVQAFRTFRTHLRQAFETYQGPEVMLDAMLSWGTNRFASVDVDESPRAVGVSNYNIRKLIRMALLILTNFSTAPLRFASVMGFFFTLFGLIGLVYVLVVYFVEGSVPGFPFLASAVIIFGGAQLFALGIIGEYLARLFERSSGRKPYVILGSTDLQGSATDRP
jgi:undecaprenyl-phosphate 4-deoxy-4-formamido-L-arabinose transferase